MKAFTLIQLQLYAEGKCNIPLVKLQKLVTKYFTAEEAATLYTQYGLGGGANG